MFRVIKNFDALGDASVFKQPAVTQTSEPQNPQKHWVAMVVWL